MSLLLSGCGGQALSQREIVRGVLFDRQNGDYSVCLVLADQNAEETAQANKVACALGDTPAQALQNAEQSLPGSVYYGLLDLAALPGECIVHTRRTDFGCETLVKGREEVLRLLPGAVCDPASIDDIMRFTSGRDKQ